MGVNIKSVGIRGCLHRISVEAENYQQQQHWHSHQKLSTYKHSEHIINSELSNQR